MVSSSVNEAGYDILYISVLRSVYGMLYLGLIQTNVLKNKKTVVTLVFPHNTLVNKCNVAGA